MAESKLIYVFFFLQLDADREEEEVFCDISMALDNKLFPSKEPAAGEMKSVFISTALILVTLVTLVIFQMWIRSDLQLHWIYKVLVLNRTGLIYRFQCI